MNIRVEDHIVSGKLHLRMGPISTMIMCCVQLLPSCPTLCDAMDCSLPGSSVYGILQARILEWVAMPCLMNGITGLIKETPSAVRCYGVKRQASVNQDPGSGHSPGARSANT